MKVFAITGGYVFVAVTTSTSSLREIRAATDGTDGEMLASGVACERTINSTEVSLENSEVNCGLRNKQ